MPRSPKQLTVASFLRKPPDPSHTFGSSGNKGKKRKLSISPIAPSIKPGKKPSQQSSPINCVTSFDNDFPQLEPTNPLLPYQLRPGKKSPPKSIILHSPSSNYRMDSAILEQGLDEVAMETPSAEEVDALLQEDPPTTVEDEPDVGSFSPLSDPNSPTAAVKAAIEAKMNENLISLDSITNDANKNDSNLTIPLPLPAIITVTKTAASAPTPRVVPPPKKPLPLFPNGLPKSFKQQQGVPASNAALAPSQKSLPKPNPSYATKAKKKPKPRELVEHILFVYSTWKNKVRIDSRDWEMIDAHLLEMELNQDPDDPLVIRIANSGYDANHRCGFIACRDLASAEWCKKVIHNIGGLSSGSRGTWRAWSKGEQPEAILCRLFFPTRFDNLTEPQIIRLLEKHNTPFQLGTLAFKSEDEAQRGRAVYIEFDTESYAYIKSKGHKVEFAMMDIDCQVYIPPKRAPLSTGISGITKLKAPNQSKASSEAPSAAAPPLAPLSVGPLAPARILPNVLSNISLSSPNKRGRPDECQANSDGSKRRESSAKSKFKAT